MSAARHSPVSNKGPQAEEATDGGEDGQGRQGPPSTRRQLTTGPSGHTPGTAAPKARFTFCESTTGPASKGRSSGCVLLSPSPVALRVPVCSVCPCPASLSPTPLPFSSVPKAQMQVPLVSRLRHPLAAESNRSVPTNGRACSATRRR